MPALDRVIETSLYVDDLGRATRFYEEVLQLRCLVRSERLCAMDVGGGHSILLLFRRGGSLNHSSPHDGSGPVHAAFAIAASELAFWDERLAAHGILIEERTTWPLGGHSIYFRDPDGHLLELATPGVWETY
jgi:catechol 2,3-dioxygenase-like lactoylglutathione lyase family enzyme